MRVLVLNEQNEEMENWYIGRDDCISSKEVADVLEREFVLAENEDDFRLLTDLSNLEI